MGKAWDVLAPRNLELGPLVARERAGSPWRNWLLARDDDGIAWLALDKANASANTLSEDVLAELNDVLGKGVGAGVRLVEREPGDAVGVAREDPVAPGRARALVACERPELEIARRENVPDFTHLAKSPFHHPRA